MDSTTSITEKEKIRLQEFLASNKEVLGIFDYLSYAILVISIFGFLGNFLNIFILLRPNLRKTPINQLLLNLAVWDTLFIGNSLVASRASTALLHQVTGDEIPVAWNYPWPWLLPFLKPYGNTALMGLQVLTILVSLERFNAVCRPFSPILNISQTNLLILANAIPILYNFPFWFSYTTQTLDDYYLIHRTPFANQPWFEVYGGEWLNFALYQAIPCISLVYMNARIVHGVRKFMRKRERLTRRQWEDRSLTRITLSICAFSLVTNTLFLLTLLFRLCDFYKEGFYTLAILVASATANSSVNFLFYSAYGVAFRKELASFFPVGTKLRGWLVKEPTELALTQSKEHSTDNNVMGMGENNGKRDRHLQSDQLQL